jgi:vacuolar-type H+-ATPase subunit E/Vma4
MDFDTGKEAEDEFSLNGWNVVSADIMVKTTSIVNKKIEKMGYKFAGNIGTYGGFKVPVSDYSSLYDIVIDTVTEIIDNYKAPETPKAKKWDQSKWDKKTK